MSLLDNDYDSVMNDIVIEEEKKKIKWFMQNYCNMKDVSESLNYETNQMDNWRIVYGKKIQYCVARYYIIVNIEGELYIKILKQGEITMDKKGVITMNKKGVIINHNYLPKTNFALRGYPHKKLPFYIRFINTKEYPIEMFMINCNSTPEEIEVPFTAKVL